MKSKYQMRLLSLLLVLAALCGCVQKPMVQTGGKADGAVYEIPAFQDAAFHADKAVDYGAVQVDESMLAQGVVSASAKSDSRLKFQVISGEMKYNYDLPSDGTPAVFPLNMGDGNYTFRLMEEVAGTKYACVWSEDQTITMIDEFQPYLRPNQMVSYSESSRCVQKARELAADWGTDTDVAAAIYSYLVEHIQYDTGKASTVENGYLPDPDETLESGKGICFDYASLAAAMFRSLGIPCKLITGYVGEKTYHAWNSIYLKNQGWITVELKAQADSWQRVDITFASGGMPENTISEDMQYTTRFTY